ncbi:helix-hairpin-helix domain-containing protein [Actinoplanes sp. NBC_00393]|uniref:ComEA family DNA-binding protein n=1 Tax=Actinoplanes sp. NBC_00393 TaxID=2975953 RepID=UPI002E2015EB
MVAPMVPFSCFSAVGFLYVGIRARRPAWWIAGLLYTVIANVCFFIGGEAADDSVAQNVAFATMFLIWPISVAHALVINGSWLRWRAAQVPWYSQPQQTPWAAPPGPVATPLPPQLQDVVPPPQQYYAGPAPASSFSPQTSSPPSPTPPGFPASPGPAPMSAFPASPGPAPGFPASPGSAPSPSFAASPGSMSPPSYAPAQGPLVEPPPDRLNVNIADARQLAAVPGIGAERAAHLVATRQARGGFSSLTEFAAVAGLAPHEFVAVRERLSCDPLPPAGETPFGRIVDV